MAETVIYSKNNFKSRPNGRQGPEGWYDIIFPWNLYVTCPAHSSYNSIKRMCGGVGLILSGNQPLPTEQEHPPLVSSGCAPAWWVSQIVRLLLQCIVAGPPTVRVHFKLHGGWTCYSGERTIKLTHRAGAHPPLTSSGCSCTVGRVQFP